VDLAINQSCSIELLNKIKSFTESCRISRLEKMFSDILEDLPESQAMNYIGEFNKNDIMQ
jgi:hypothetical protein